MKAYTELIPADKVRGIKDWTETKFNITSTGSLYAWTQ